MVNKGGAALRAWKSLDRLVNDLSSYKSDIIEILDNFSQSGFCLYYSSIRLDVEALIDRYLIATSEHPLNLKSDYARLRNILTSASSGFFEDKFVPTLIPGSYFSIGSRLISNWLIWKSCKIRSELAFKKLHDFLSKNEAQVKVTGLIGGARADKTIEFKNMIKIVPVSHYIESGENIDLHFSLQGVIPLHENMFILQITINQKNFFRLMNDNAHAFSREDFDLESRIIKCIKNDHALWNPGLDIINIMATQAKSRLALLGTWNVFEDPCPFERNSIGGYYSPPSALHTEFPSMAIDLHAERSCNIWLKFLPLPKPAIESMRISLDRLNSNYKKPHVDSIIDLGISFEVLLTHYMDDRDPIANAIRTRSAMIAREVGEDATEIYEFMNLFYNLRSRAVHTGSVNIKYKERRKYGDENKIVERAAELCSKFHTLLIEKGGFPDWTSIMLTSFKINRSFTSIEDEKPYSE